ncbi:GNAT family N-acetyltransferase [Aquibacillus saliphilus]|uniref:GNAT family N-acetyltransferase n=1 Tax=Aquibacillus saliphilus TaxID=1909422 RepID=UPI001CF04181|nr:GNAT family N-acetyltransferase [Aquibacillus saliphilus]
MSNIKKINRGDYDQVLKLGEYAFNYTLSDQDRTDRHMLMGNQLILGSYTDGELASKLHVLPMELFLGSKVLSFGGIAGVATWPEHRRKGHVQQLMRKALEEMKSKSLPISMLHPFSISFYRRYGFELTQYVHKYQFKPLDLSVKKVDGYTQRVNYCKYKDILQTLYEKSASSYSLMMKREEWWWEKKVLSKGDQIVIYFDSFNVPQGYLISNIVDETLKVEEFIFNNGDACYGLLEWIRNHDSMTTEVELVVQPRDQIAFYFDNPKITFKKEAYFMTRIVDFQTLISVYPFFRSNDKLLMAIHLSDHVAEWNNGSWTIELNNNSVSKVRNNVQKKCDIAVTTDVQTLASLLFGSEPIDRLIALGSLVVEGDIELLKQVIQPLEPALLDFF